MENCQQSSTAEIVTVDVQKAKDLIHSGYPYLEVRTEEEFKKGHVGAEKILNIPYMFFKPEGRMKNPKFVEEVSAAYNKDDHLVVGCQSGARSLKASTDLVNAGFKHVYNMDGGYAAWVENGFSVKKPSTEMPGEIVTVDVHKAKDLIHSGYPYLEVRTEEEFKKGHVDAEKIVNIPYMFFKPEGRMKNPKFVEEVLAACNKDDHLVVGCQSGARSLKASTDLVNAGFKHVYNMDGGYAAWVENGFPVKKPSAAL
ncbi:protein HIGH ARSENIC CONTENT 1, mitochondrial-like [Cornus florida]|uniref:protein HIGH ARSENIC CONTENT 1, mitochondrial-like n=1 Tax=Cornus florida TaxID=4283 RepID=UPI00289F6679|nr:protein HIGH ARSENIC CONTENT 1, mitochondrial-like [Cornus florida]